jgi:uncharacterized protein YraI
MKRTVIFAAIGFLLVGGGLLALPHTTTQAQSNSEVITLDDATPGIDVVVSAPAGTSGVIGLEIAQASVLVTDAAGGTVFETSDPRVHAVELRFLPDAGTHTLSIERLPGMANAYVRVVSQLDLTDLGPAQVVSTAGLNLQQEVDLPLMAASPVNQASVTIPPETRATLVASVPGGAVLTQVVDSSGSPVATLYNSLFDGLALTLDSGTYNVSLLNNRAGTDTVANVKLMPATPGLLSDLVMVSNETTQGGALDGQAAATPNCTVAINASSINLRSGPGTGYTVLEYGFRGQELPVGGTDTSGSWFVVGTEGGSAWMSGTLGILHGTCSDLPVYDIPYREAQQAQIIVQQPSGGTVAQPQTNAFPLAFGEHEEHEHEYEGYDDD